MSEVRKDAPSGWRIGEVMEAWQQARNYTRQN